MKRAKKKLCSEFMRNFLLHKHSQIYIDVVEQTGCGLILISDNQDVSPDNVSEKLGDVFLSS